MAAKEQQSRPNYRINARTVNWFWMIDFYGILEYLIPGDGGWGLGVTAVSFFTGQNFQVPLLAYIFFY